MDEPPPVLLPCSICTRTFRPEVLERHTKICEKSATKKRRPFDSFKSRVSGTELEEFLGPAALPGQPIKKPPERSPQKKPARGPPKWKETHESLIAVLRAARGENGNVPNVNKHAGNEQCPSCGRYFGPRAFDRHVEFCKEKLARIKTTPSKASQAHERLEARIKYRAPLSLKPKLTTKEKYSPMLPRKADSTEACVQTKTTQLNSAVKTPKPLPSKTSVNQFTRQSPTRTSQRQRSVSPSKKSVVSSKASSRNESSQMKQANTPKIKDSLRETEDLRPKTTAKLTAQDKIRNRYSKISREQEDDRLVPSRSKTTSRSKTRDKRFPSSDDDDDEEEEEEGNKHIRQSGRTFALPRAENLKTTSSRPIFQTDIGYRSRGIKEKKKPRELPSSSEDDDNETVSSRSTTATKTCRNKNKISFPVINDLSVNDETFGISVSPCSFGTKPVQVFYKPPFKVFPSSKPSKNKEKTLLDTAPKKLPSPKKEILQRSPRKSQTSKIPKSILPNKLRIEKCMNDSESVRKERERTATIKKNRTKEWKNLSEMSTEDLEKFSEQFDDWPVEKVSKDTENLSESAVWEIAGKEFLNCDASYSSNVKNEPKCEDEIVVLHLTDPLKLSEKETDMKLSVSEPCLSPSFREKSPDSKSDVIVFTAVSDLRQTRHPTRKKYKKPLKIKILPRIRHGRVREKTFLANGYPLVKRRKLNSEQTNYQVSPDEQKIFTPLEKDLRNVESPEKNVSSGRETQEGAKPKKFEFFQVGKDAEETKPDAPPVVKKFDYFEITDEKPLENTDKKKFKPKNNKRNEKAKKLEESFPKSEKHELRYSDDESERMRVEKVKTLKIPKKTSEAELKGCKFRKGNSLENIEEAEGEDSIKPFRDEIEIEDFIVSKPDRDEILSGDGKGLEVLFPKPKKISGLVGKSESSTAVRLGFVLDSVYDLKSKKENVKEPRSDRIFKKRPRNGMILPEIVETRKEKGDKKNSIMSLVQIWKNKKEIAGNDCGDVIKTGIPAPKNLKLAPLDTRNPYQIAVLPFVLRRKIAEVVVQVGCLEKGEKKEESYDPFKQAERQMMALLSWPSTADLKGTSNTDTSNNNKNESINNKMNNIKNKSFPQPRLSPSRNLEASPTSAFSKYPYKDLKIPKDVNENPSGNKMEKSKESDKNETYTYSAADDWEQIFEKHFDLNRNEMTEKTTKTVKSALDGLLKKSPKKKDLSDRSGKDSVWTPQRNRSNASENSVLDEMQMAFTSTPKDSGSVSSSKVRGSSSGPKTYRKISGDDRGRISPPEDFGDFSGKENRSDKSNRNSGVSLSSLSFCSQVSDATIADDEVLRNNLEIIGVASPRNARRKFVRSQSVFDERNKMLFAKTFDRNFSSSDENEMDNDHALPNILNLQNIKSGNKQAQPKSVPSHFPRSQSVLEERRKGDGDHSDEGDHVSSPDANKNRKAKMSGDSAYSSLNRKSPHPNVQPLNPHIDDRLSSSGSENSLPPLTTEHSFKPRSLDFDALSGKKDQSFKMSKFCHECGSKYPVPIAKFCCECGVRRLII